MQARCTEVSGVPEGPRWHIRHCSLLPLKKTIIDGNPVLQWLMPIPVEWLIERDWWVQTHWEDGDSREVYRQLLRSPILRDMVSTARLQPGARAMVVHIDQVPEPEAHKPTSADIFTMSLAHHRFLIPSQELEIVYDTMSADYMLDMSVNACFETMEMIKTEMTMRDPVECLQRREEEASQG